MEIQLSGSVRPSLVPAPVATFTLPLRSGFGAIGVLAAGFCAWACLAPLASATIVSGTVVVNSDRKKVADPEGGVLEELYVREGDQVQAGQPLGALDRTQLRIALSSLERLIIINAVQNARLAAERSHAPDVVLPDEAEGVRSAPFPDVAEQQRRLMTAKREMLGSQIASLQNQEEQARELMTFLDEQLSAIRARLEFIESQLKGAAELARLGAGARTRVSQLGQSRAELHQERLALDARKTEAEHRASRSRRDIEWAGASAMESVESESQIIRREHLELSERLTNVREQLERRVVRSPVQGTIINLAVRAAGEVVLPSVTIAEVVPSEDELVISVQVQPSDVGAAEPGARVELRPLESGHRHSPLMQGVIRSVSADRIFDRSKPAGSFEVRIDVQGGARATRLGTGIEVSIHKGEQTLLASLAAPLINFFSTALRD